MIVLIFYYPKGFRHLSSLFEEKGQGRDIRLGYKKRDWYKTTAEFMHRFTPRATFRTASHVLISLQLQNLLTTTLASLLASPTQPALTVLFSTVWPALLMGFTLTSVKSFWIALQQASHQVVSHHQTAQWLLLDSTSCLPPFKESPARPALSH